VKRTVVLLALVALIAPASAAAHATLIRTTPADGAVLNGAPQSVRVEFDDRIHVETGNAAVSNANNASVLDGAPRTAGHTLVLPLRAVGRRFDVVVGRVVATVPIDAEESRYRYPLERDASRIGEMFLIAMVARIFAPGLMGLAAHVGV